MKSSKHTKRMESTQRNRSIYILLIKSGTIISRMINRTTSDRYTHASISFDESLQPLYSFARKYLYLPLPAGLRTEPLYEGMFEYYSTMPCALYECKVTERTFQRAKQRVERMMKKKKHYRFSVLGLFLCRLGIPWHRKHLYFCSEFVSSVLKDSGAMKLPKLPSLMRPNDYTKCQALSCLFEGRLDQLKMRLQHNE